MSTEPQESQIGSLVETSSFVNRTRAVPVAQEPPAPTDAIVSPPAYGPDPDNCNCPQPWHRHTRQWHNALLADAQLPPLAAPGSAQERPATGFYDPPRAIDNLIPPEAFGLGAQEPADPPWLTQAINVAIDVAADLDMDHDEVEASIVRATLPILRAGIRAELLAEQVAAMKPGRQS